MAGIPTESPRVLRESRGSSHSRLTSAEDNEEALLSGYPPVGLLDASNIYHAEEKGNRLPRPARPERRGLRSVCGQITGSKTQFRTSYGFFGCAGAGCEAAGGWEAGCVLDCG